MKFFALFFLFISTVMFIGCGTESTKDTTYTTASYTFINARLTSNSKSFVSKFESNSDIFKTLSTAYTSSSDVNISWEDNASKRLYLSQDFTEINSSIETLVTDKKLIYISVGNANSSTLPVLEIKGPLTEDLVFNNPIIKVIQAANLDEYKKLRVTIEPSQLDTGTMEYKDTTPSWKEIPRGTNMLFNVLDERGIILNGSQETFTLNGNSAYAIVVYESSKTEDMPFITVVDVTPN